jgi:hypothetical protein
MADGGADLARAISDGDDRLVSADGPLARLQLRCGGNVPGTIAVPALLETVRKSRRYGLKLSRAIGAQIGQEAVTAWVEVTPREDTELGCDIVLRHYQASQLSPEDAAAIQHRRTGIDQQLAELTARLDSGQRLLSVEADALDLQSQAEAMRQGLGKVWTDFAEVEGNAHHQPLHWRLLDGAGVSVAGSGRPWRASLIPLGRPGEEPTGFELGLTSDQPPPQPGPGQSGQANSTPGMIGRDIAPVLRQPISRIIANAETIRTRLAGPLAKEYSDYASDIAAAGQHLLALLDDLSDLEVVEAEDFSTAPDHIDLADVARRAAGILGVRARERGILLDPPRADEALPAVAEFRRVLQILLNLIGNAVRYSPANSQVWIRLEERDGMACVTVADQGQGLSEDEQQRIFEKFERLGRSGDGGSGLGLYISRRLARAMGGELSVESAPGKGARFSLELPGER